MNKDTTRHHEPKCVIWLLSVQGILLVLMFAFAPLAWHMVLFSDIYTHGVWRADHASDPLYTRRCVLVIFGLLASLATLLLAAISIMLSRKKRTIALAVAFALCAMVVGWRMYPYWATGVFNATGGTIKTGAFDPKALIPMVWIRDLWRIPILMLHLGTFIGIPVSLIFALLDLGNRRWATVIITLTCHAVTLASYLSAPNYSYWLID